VPKDEAQAVGQVDLLGRQLGPDLPVFPVQATSLGQVLAELLDEERVPVGVGAEPGGHARGRRPAAQRRRQLPHLVDVEGTEDDPAAGGVADQSPKGVGQGRPHRGLVAAVGAEDEDPRRLEPVDEVLEQGERGRVRPVEVLQHEQERSDRGQPQEHVPQRRVQEVPRLLGGEVEGRGQFGEAPAQRGHDPGHLGAGVAQEGQQLFVGELPGELLEDLQEREPGNGLLGLQATPEQSRRPPVVGLGGRLLGQAGLADAGLAAHQHEATSSRRCRGHQLGGQVPLHRSPDVGRPPGGGPEGGPGARRRSRRARRRRGRGLVAPDHVEARGGPVHAEGAGTHGPVEVVGQRGVDLVELAQRRADGLRHRQARPLGCGPGAPRPAAEPHPGRELFGEGVELVLGAGRPLPVGEGVRLGQLLAELVEAPPVGGEGGAVDDRTGVPKAGDGQPLRHRRGGGPAVRGRGVDGCHQGEGVDLLAGTAEQVVEVAEALGVAEAGDPTVEDHRPVLAFASEHVDDRAASAHRTSPPESVRVPPVGTPVPSTLTPERR
jgi:hypothetical protein